MLNIVTVNDCWWHKIALSTAGNFLLELLNSLSGTKKLFDLFNFIITVMKYNAVYLKEDAVAGIIRFVLYSGF